MSLLSQLNLPASHSRSELSPALFDRFRNFIYEQTGLYFQDNKQYLLESRVGRRLSKLGMEDHEAYFRLLKNGGMKTELPALINAITINETSFFRTPAQYKILEKEIIPELIQDKQRKGIRHIRLWSAACSTGDEPYTLALIVKEKLMPRYPGIRFEIVGSDINTEVLDAAKAATYSERAVRSVPPAMMQKYFTSKNARYTLAPEIRNLVRFQHLNLSDRRQMLPMRGFDVVFCANVLIYFDAASKQQVITSLYNSLQASGYLLVGSSETLYGVTQAFQPARFEKTIAYKKGDSHA